MLQDFFSFSAVVLGHATLKNEEVDQTKHDGKQSSLLGDSTKFPEREGFQEGCLWVFLSLGFL